MSESKRETFWKQHICGGLSRGAWGAGAPFGRSLDGSLDGLRSVPYLMPTTRPSSTTTLDAKPTLQSSEVSMRTLVMLAALAVSAACQPAPKSTSTTATTESGSAAARAGLSADDEAAIRAVDAAWARAASAGDEQALTALYASDATLLPPGEPIAKGEAMKKYNAAMTAGFSGPTELTTTAVEGGGDLAYAVGEYRATLTPKKAGAKPLPTEVGKYLEVLKKQGDGSWKIIYDMWSPNAAPGK
jgi:uncharacterized protein (TIGR02246 family)